ncbi:MAG: hypothetical protein RI894_2529 [Bacteroidota bacterium]|jgi:uncharacterized protein (TIGR02453 family)
MLTKESLSYLKDLHENNNRVWFEANKKRYETHVKLPFEAFINACLERFKADGQDVPLTLQAKNCIFRIYRDVRFSADKTPYKNHVSAVISPTGRKNDDTSGIYIEIAYGRLFIASGIYAPNPAQLLQIRNHIAANKDEFVSLLQQPAFVAYYGGEIRGEKNKRLTADLQRAAEAQPLLYNKQFYFVNELPSSTCLQADFVDILMQHYNAAMPMNDFLAAAIL